MTENYRGRRVLGGGGARYRSKDAGRARAESARARGGRGDAPPRLSSDLARLRSGPGGPEPGGENRRSDTLGGAQARHSRLGRARARVSGDSRDDRRGDRNQGQVHDRVPSRGDASRLGGRRTPSGEHRRSSGERAFGKFGSGG